MGRLVYSAITSLDGFVADESGGFDWAAPDEEVHSFVNDLERDVGTYLYGRRMYDVMRYWATAPTAPAAGDAEDAGHDYARIWQAADKVVYSASLDAVSTPRTRLERVFDVPAVTRLVADSPVDVSIGGPTLAGDALRAGLVDQLHLLVVPELVGGGRAVLPAGVRTSLRLESERRFGSGVVHLHYTVRH